jgi:hypothetical protein
VAGDLDGDRAQWSQNDAHALVCSHKVALVVMQRAIATNWITALAAVGHPKGR